MLTGVYLTFVSIICAAHGSWLNTLDGPFSFTCPSGNQAINRFYSIHDNHAEDRLFDLSCKNATKGTATCSWTAQYVNNFDETFAFQCARNGYISGVESYHHNHEEDRRFKFYCCEAFGFHMEDCALTGPKNKYDGPVDYTVPTGKTLRGITSSHSNHHEDRIWNFDICNVYEHRDETEIGVGK